MAKTARNRNDWLMVAMEAVRTAQGHPERPATYRELEELTGVPASTIQAMSTGRVVGLESLWRFTEELDLDVLEWFERCGYVYYAGKLRERDGGKQQPCLLDRVFDPLTKRERQQAEEMTVMYAERVAVPTVQERRAVYRKAS